MIEAIGYLHSKDLIHRDVKHANILIDRQGYLKLCDFGITRKLKKNEFCNDKVGSRITWAPEVIKMEKYNRMPDWWSVGIMIFQLMCKDTPFHF